jgi:hypothetical protein
LGGTPIRRMAKKFLKNLSWLNIPKTKIKDENKFIVLDILKINTPIKHYNLGKKHLYY